MRIKAPYIMPVLISAMRKVFSQPMWEGNPERREVALTFDDGPSPRFMPALLEVLKEEEVKVTFFVLGSRIKYQNGAELIREAEREGHQIGLHGETHADLTRLSNQALASNAENNMKSVRDALGWSQAPVKWHFRPPFGAINARVIDEMRKLRCEMVMASILPGSHVLIPAGWEEAPVVMTSRILRHVRNGSIIGLHICEDIGLEDKVHDTPQAAECARQVIRGLKKRGYQMVRVDEMDKQR